MRNLTLLFIVLSGLLPTEVLAHGVIIDIALQSPTVIVKSSYSLSQPLKGANVTVYSPSAMEIPWLTGITDNNGNFAFVPDSEGDWVFDVDDQKGHRERVTIAVAGEFFLSEAAGGKSPEQGSSSGTFQGKGYRIVTGLSLIFGIAGVFYGYRSGQVADKKQSKH